MEFQEQRVQDLEFQTWYFKKKKSCIFKKKIQYLYENSQLKNLTIREDFCLNYTNEMTTNLLFHNKWNSGKNSRH